MDKPFHPTDDDLMLFLDRELDADFSRQVEAHVGGCSQCSSHLRLLKQGSCAYDEYRQAYLQPAASEAWPEWSNMRKGAPHRISRTWMRWAAAGLAAAVALVVFQRAPEEDNRKRTSEILMHAESSPEKTTRGLVFTTAGRRWEQSTNSGDASRVQLLFLQAHYSWQEPLSARSYANWRDGLREKKDQVWSIRDANGTLAAYRLRTRTEAGILQAASLTLQATTYHPTHASFEFRGEDPIEVREREDERARPSRAAEPRETPPAPGLKQTETRAGPEEELRVMEALSHAGNDDEDPVTVRVDSARHQIVVTALGVAVSRREEIARAVAGFPGTVLQFGLAQPKKTPVASQDTYSNPESSPFRHKLEEQAGGARTWQDLVDRALESSSGLLARTHVLLLMAEDFGPTVEGSLSPEGRTILYGLQQRRVAVIEFETRQLRQTLTPVMASGATEANRDGHSGNRPWQNGAFHLYERAKILDDLLDRYLTLTYDEDTGSKLRVELGRRLDDLEAVVREESSVRSK